MGTPAAERQRRSRAHRKGMHDASCPAGCDALGAVTAAVTSKTVETVTAAPERPKRARKRVTAAPAVTQAPAEDPGPGERTPGGIETMTRAFVDALPYRDGDPRRLLGEIAVKLAKRVDDDGAVPAAVRELRTLLAQLAEAPNGPAGAVDEQRLNRYLRRLDGILAQAVAAR